jgi:hypothetical protein
VGDRWVGPEGWNVGEGGGRQRLDAESGGQGRGRRGRTTSEPICLLCIWETYMKYKGHTRSNQSFYSMSMAYMLIFFTLDMVMAILPPICRCYGEGPLGHGGLGCSSILVPGLTLRSAQPPPLPKSPPSWPTSPLVAQLPAASSV